MANRLSPNPSSDIADTDGSIDWSGGVDSIKVTTIVSAANPNGLARNELSWLINGTVRDGGITPRGGWNFLGAIAPSQSLFQGGYMYNPPDGSDPYLVVSISGNIVKIPPLNLPTSRNLTIEDSAETVPTLGPWFITLRNVQTTTNSAVIGPVLPAGSVFTSAMAGYTGALGYTFTPAFGNITFTVPPEDGTVVVQLPAPYQTTPVGSVISLAGNKSVTTRQFPFSGSSSGGSSAAVFETDTATSDFIVVEFTPAFQQIKVHQPGNPPFLFKSYFCQAEEFLIIQCGDSVTLPLFWDGNQLRRSKGITNTAVAPGTPAVNEIPAGTMMDYYMGRLWYAQGSTFSAGDIVGGASGTQAYAFRDAVLNVTENPLVLGGDGFSVPRNEGSITALAHNANQDAALGQGKLFAFTSKGVHQLTVPVTRAAWIAANTSNQPLLVPVQLANGTASDRSVVAVNGDLFYQSPQGDIRTLLTAVRYFNQWGNIPISSNVNRVTQFSDNSLLQYGTGIYFNNRLIESVLPILSPQGAVHQASVALDFESISTFGDNLQPTWEGMYEGLDIMQMFTGVFSGEERAFAITVSRIDQSIGLWELTKDAQFDNTDTRIQMISEFPAFTWGNEFSLKKEVSAELWIDRLFGEVVFLLEYRPDGESCWQKWHEWKVCSPRNSCENQSVNPCTGLAQAICYPLVTFGESYRQTLTLPRPPENCSATSGRPAYINYQCQPRLTVRGFCRIRGLLLYAEPVDRKLYAGRVC